MTHMYTNVVQVSVITYLSCKEFFWTYIYLACCVKKKYIYSKCNKFSITLT